jgi:excisionase family DNA binding protein
LIKENEAKLRKSGYRPGLKRLLTAKEAAEYLGIHPKTLWEWSRTGLIPMVKFDSKRVKDDIRDLDDLIEKNKIYDPSSEFEN